MSKIPSRAKADIIKAALLLFLEKGYKSVTFQDLVKKTGVSKGAIYHYFSSKETLLTAVFELLAIQSPQSPEFTPDLLIRDYASFKEVYIEIRRSQLKGFKAFLGTEVATFNWVLFCLEAVEANEQLREVVAGMASAEKQFLKSCFVSLQKNSGLLPGKDPLVLAECLYYILEGAGLVLYLAGDKKDENYIDEFSQLLENFFKILM